jgi:hypothetical protein
MLASTLIEKLEKLKREKGDLPVYFKGDWIIYPLSAAWVENVDEDQVEDDDSLNVGELIICIS